MSIPLAAAGTAGGVSALLMRRTVLPVAQRAGLWGYCLVGGTLSLFSFRLVEVAGLSLWFYLIPALFAAYFGCPLSIIIALFVMIVAVAGLFLGTYQVTGPLMLQNR